MARRSRTRRSTENDTQWKAYLDSVEDHKLYWEGYRSYGYSSNYKGKSASSFWSSRFNYGGSNYRNDKERFFDILNTITRSSNLVENARSEIHNGSERKFQCRWSDGKNVNKVEEDLIYLPPDVVVKENSLKPDWTGEQQTDVLIGQALTESGIKTTTSIEGQRRITAQLAEAKQSQINITGEMGKYEEELRAFVDACQRCKELNMAPEIAELEKRIALLNRHGQDLMSKKKESHLKESATTMADHIWYAAEVLAAQKSILDNYPGFQPYFGAQVEYYTHKPFIDEMTAAMKAGIQAAPLAENLLIWQMVHPDMPAELTPEYETAINECLDLIEQAKTSEERATCSLQAAEKLLRLFPQSWESKQKPRHGDGNGLSQQNFKGKVINNVATELAHIRADADMGEPTGTHGMEQGDRYNKSIKDVNVVGNFDVQLRSYQRELNPQITALRNRLKLRNEIPVLREHGLRHGQLDEGSLYKLGFYRTGHPDDRVFEERSIITHPDLSVSILIDESGSMSGSDGSGSSKFEEAKKICIIVASALLPLDGVTVSILGHTAEGHGYGGSRNEYGILLHHYLTPQNKNVGAITQIRAYSNNIDGYAIQETARKMIAWYPHSKTRLLVHVSDGHPAGSEYGGELAFEHMRRVREYARRNNVSVFGIGVGREFTADKCDVMYGSGRWASIQQMSQAGLIISNLISQEVRRSVAL